MPRPWLCRQARRNGGPAPAACCSTASGARLLRLGHPPAAEQPGCPAVSCSSLFLWVRSTDLVTWRGLAAPTGQPPGWPLNLARLRGTRPHAPKHSSYWVSRFVHSWLPARPSNWWPAQPAHIPCTHTHKGASGSRSCRGLCRVRGIGCIADPGKRSTMRGPSVPGGAGPAPIGLAPRPQRLYFLPRQAQAARLRRGMPWEPGARSCRGPPGALEVCTATHMDVV